MKELEDCVSDSLDLEDVVEDSDVTEKVEEVKSRKRKPDQVEEERKEITKKSNMTFDQKKKAKKAPTPKKMQDTKQEEVWEWDLIFLEQGTR